MYSKNLLLRNKVNIIISFIIIILIGFSIFQNIVLKTKGNNIKLVIMLLLFLIIFGLTGIGNKYIIDNLLSKEKIKKYNNEEYIVVEKGSEEYYFKIYSDYIKASKPKYSISETVFKDGDIEYRTKTIVEFDNKGNVINTTSESDVESGE